jgi:hypothetical protein
MCRLERVLGPRGGGGGRMVSVCSVRGVRSKRRGLSQSSVLAQMWAV